MTAPATLGGSWVAPFVVAWILMAAPARADFSLTPFNDTTPRESDRTDRDVSPMELAQAGGACQRVDARSGFGNLSGNISPGYGTMSGSCGGSGGEYVVQWVAETTGVVCFDTTGTNPLVDTIVYVQGQCGAPQTELACNDDPGPGRLQAMAEVHVQAGYAYYVVVDSYSNFDSPQPFVLTARPGPCQAAPPTGARSSGNSTGAATASAGGPGSCSQPEPVSGFGSMDVTLPATGSTLAGQCGGGGNEYVFRWTATQPGAICVSSTGTPVDTILYVRGQCSQPATEIACNDDTAGSLQGEATVYVEAGASYDFVIDTYSNEGRPIPARLTVTPGACASGSPPPATTVGSSCQRPFEASGYGSLDIQLPGVPGRLTGSCGGEGSEYVMAWTAGHTGDICVSTPDTSVDTVVYVQRQCGNPATEIACNDDPPNHTGLQAMAQAQVQQGQVYYIVVDQYSVAGGPVTVTVQRGACDIGAPSGQCEPAQALSGGDRQSVQGTTVGATNSTAGTCGSISGPDVAHRFTPSRAGTYCASTEGSSFDTILYVREGACEAAANELACNDDGVGLASQLEFSARSGQAYYIIVDSYANAAGPYQLTVTPGACGGVTSSDVSCDSVSLSNYRVGSTRYFCTSPAYFSIDSSASVDVQVEVGREGEPGYMRIPWHLEPGTNNVRLHANPSSLNETFMGEVTVTPLCSRGAQRSTGAPLRSSRRLVFGKQACDFFRANTSEREAEPSSIPVFTNSGEGK